MANPDDRNNANDVELALMSPDFRKLIKTNSEDQAPCLDALKPWFVLADAED